MHDLEPADAGVRGQVDQLGCPPPKIVDGKKADTVIEVWEDQLVKCSVEYGETLSNKVKVAVSCAMLPKDLQERVLDRCAVSRDTAKESDAATILAKITKEVKQTSRSRDVT